MWSQVLILLVLIGYSRESSPLVAEVSPDLYKNVMRPEWGINFKYNGAVHHNIDRVWVVTRVPIPELGKLKIHPLEIDTECSFLFKVQNNVQQSVQRQQIQDAMSDMCSIIRPYVRHIQAKEQYLMTKISNFYDSELYTALPALRIGLPQSRTKRAVSTLLLSSLVPLVTVGMEALGGYLQRKRNEAVNKALYALHEDRTLIKNQLAQFENDLVMYGKYSIDGIDKSLQTINDMHNRTTKLEQLLAGLAPDLTLGLLGLADGSHNIYGPSKFSLALSLFLEQSQEEHNSMLQELLGNFGKLMKGIEKLSQGYLPSELFPPSTLHRLTAQVLKAVKKSHKEYSLAIEQLGNYYDMKLVTLAVEPETHSLLITFPIFIQPYRNQPLALYEIETVKVPIPDENEAADSYSEVTVQKPYIAVNKDFYIQLRIEELRMCKKIKFEYYCEELFLVKHKTVQTCESALYYNKDNSSIIAACSFNYFFNTTVIPSVLDGGTNIVLANMVNQKRLTCADTFNLGAPLPSYKYVTVSRSILCNCEIDASLSYVLRSIGSCSMDRKPPAMYFTANMAFQETFRNSMQNFSFPPTYSKEEFQYPVHLNNTAPALLTAQEPKSLQDLREFVQKSPKKPQVSLTVKTSPPNETDQFTFLHQDTQKANRAHHIFAYTITSVCIVLLIFAAVLFLKYYKTRALITSLTLMALPNSVNAAQDMVCSEPWLTKVTVAVTIIGTTIYILRQLAKLQWLRGYTFDTTTTVYLLLTKNIYYLPIPLLKVQVPAFALKEINPLRKTQISVQKHFLWDTIIINWQNSSILKNDQPLTLPSTLTVPLKHKLKFRYLTFGDQHNIFLMAKQGNNWANLHAVIRDGEVSVQE